MQYVGFIKLPDGNLRIQLLPEHRQDVQEIQDNEEWGITIKFLEVIEYQLCNGWREVRPEEIGALTDAPILTDDWDENDMGELTRIDNVWWLPEYAVVDEVQKILDQGYIDFTLAKGE